MAKPSREHSRFRASFNRDPLEWTKYKNESRGFGTVGALHKGYLDERPYRFFNELVAGALAQALRLPMPPFALTWLEEKERDGDDEPIKAALFSSIDFNFERETTPKPDFDILNEQFQEDCAGVLLFDILVANPDRSRDNIWCDNAGFPKRFFIYDHDVALLGSEHDGIERLGREQDRLGLRFGAGTDDYHPFLRRVRSKTWFDNWYSRFYLIPAWFIDDVCEKSAKTIKLKPADVKKVQRFLKERCRQMDWLIQKHRALFTSIGDWSKQGTLF